MWRLVAVVLVLAGSGCATMGESSVPLGRYVAELETPAGPLPFEVELSEDRALIKNGQEWIEVPDVAASFVSSSGPLSTWEVTLTGVDNGISAIQARAVLP